MEPVRLGRLLLALVLLSTVAVGFDLEGCLNEAFVEDLPPGARKAARQVLAKLRNHHFLHLGGEVRIWGKLALECFLNLQRSLKQLVREATFPHANIFRPPDVVPQGVGDLRPALRGLLHLLMIEPQFGPTGIEALRCRLDETLWVLPENTKLAIPLVMARGHLRVLASRIILALDRNLLSPDAGCSSSGGICCCCCCWWSAYETIANRVEPLLIMLRGSGEGDDLRYWQRLMASAHPKSFQPFQRCLIDSIKRLSADFRALWNALPSGEERTTERGRLEQLSLFAAISGWLEGIEGGFKVLGNPAIGNSNDHGHHSSPSKQGDAFAHLANRVLTILTFETLKLSGALTTLLFKATLWRPGSLLTLAAIPAWQNIDGCLDGLARSAARLDTTRLQMYDSLLRSTSGSALRRCLRRAIKQLHEDDQFPVEEIPDLVSYLIAQPGLRYGASDPDLQRYQADLGRSRDAVNVQWVVLEEIMSLIIRVAQPAHREELLLSFLLSGNVYRLLIWASALLAALDEPGSPRLTPYANFERWETLRLAAHIIYIITDTTTTTASGKKSRDKPYLATAMKKIFGAVGLTGPSAFTDS